MNTNHIKRLKKQAYKLFSSYAPSSMTRREINAQWQDLLSSSNIRITTNRIFILADFKSGILTIHAMLGDATRAAKLLFYHFLVFENAFPTFITFERRNYRPHTYPAADIARHFLPRHLFRRNPSQSQP